MAPTEYANDTWGNVTYTSNIAPVDNWWDKYFDRLEKIVCLRYSWRFNEYKKHIPEFILLNIKVVIRKMILSYSGWIARKGYKKKKGK